MRCLASPWPPRPAALPSHVRGRGLQRERSPSLPFPLQSCRGRVRGCSQHPQETWDPGPHQAVNKGETWPPRTCREPVMGASRQLCRPHGGDWVGHRTQEAPPVRSGCQGKGCSPPAPLSLELGSWPPGLTGYSWCTSISAGRTVMAGQRPGPALALVQKCGWLALAQSCCSVHLGRPAQVRVRGAPTPAASRAQPAPQGPHRVSRAHQPQ